MNPLVFPLRGSSAVEPKKPHSDVPTWRNSSAWKPQGEWDTPTDMWAHPTGPVNGFFTIDFDTYKDTYRAAIESDPEGALFEDLLNASTTRKFRSMSGGYQLEFRYVDGITNAGGINGAVDIRGAQGYVARGAGYTLIQDNPREDAPAWLIERLQKRSAAGLATNVPAPEFTAELADLVAALPIEMSGLYEDDHTGSDRSAYTWRFICDLCESGWPIEDTYLLVMNSQDVLSKHVPDASLWRQVQKAYAERKPRKDFWNARPVLLSIKRNSQRLRANPWGMFGIVAMRALNTIPAEVRFSSQFGSASLNAAAMLMGRSGAGKSRAMGNAEEIVRLGVDIPTATPGSGESMVSAFAENVKGEIQFHRHNMMFTFDEIGQFTATGTKSGSTLNEYVKTAFTGGPLGRILADKNKSLQLPAHSYRATMAMNAQPGRCVDLFNAENLAGGLPQRFLWFGVSRTQEMRNHKDDTDMEPYEVPERNWSGVARIKATRAMRDFYDQFEDDMEDEKIPEYKSHDGMNRTKIAVALMVLDGRTELNDEDWDLSALVMAHSDSVREDVRSELAAAEAASNRAKGVNAAKAKRAEDNTLVELDTVEARVAEVLKAKGPLTPGVIRNSISKNQRQHVEAVLNSPKFMRNGNKYAVAN